MFLTCCRARLRGGSSVPACCYGRFLGEVHVHRRTVHVAVTAGLVTALSLGSVPTPAIAEALSGSGVTQAEQGVSSDQATEDAAAGVSTQQEEASQGDAAETNEQASPTITAVASPGNITCEAGSVSLPGTVSVTLSDGTTEDRSVSWQVDGASSQDAFNALEPGSYTVAGTVEGTDKQPSFTLTISAATAPGIADEQAAPEQDAQAAPVEEAVPAEDEGAPAASAPAANDVATQVDGDIVTLEYEGQTWTYERPQITALVGQQASTVGSLVLVELTNTDTGEVEEYHLTPGGDFSSSWQSSAPVGADGCLTAEGAYAATLQTSIGQFIDVTFEADINVLSVTSIPNLDVTCIAGSTTLSTIDAPSVTLSDGSLYQAWITWDADERKAAEEGLSTPGEYVITGVIQNTNIEVQATVSVQEIREVRGATAFVEPGFEPTLPDYVYVVSSTGLEQAIPVTWDAIDPSDYEHENVFEVMGTVQGTSQRAVATVYVSEVTSVSEQTMVVAVGGSITWLSGVTVTNALGNTNWVDPAWDLPEEGDERLQQAGTFDIYGAIPGSDNQAVCHVMVIDPVESSYEESVKLTVGESYLPGDISIELPDGSSSHIAVDWIWPDMDLFNRAGSFDVEGVISGTDIPVTLHVTMVDIQSIDALDSIGTVEGVVPELPYFVDVTYTDGSRGEEEVEWSVPDPSEILSDASPITITGQTRFGTNREVEVQVEVLWAQPAREPVEVSTLVGVAPTLPYTVPMTMSDGSRQQLVVQWEQPTPDQYATAGTTFEAKGYVAGSDYPVTAEVAVCAAAKDGTATEVSTIVGVAPNLSSDINVTLDNGVRSTSSGASRGMRSIRRAMPRRAISRSRDGFWAPRSR